MSTEKLERTKVLEEAILITGGDRAVNYGRPESNNQRIADLWNTYIGGRGQPEAPLTAGDVTLMMVLLKVARLQNNPLHRDSFVDIAGYAAVGWETVAQGGAHDAG